MSRLLSNLLFATMLMASASAIATPFSYDESVDGDIRVDFVTGTPQFTFDVGLNTIAGDISYFPFDNVFDFDEFEFVLGANMRLNSLTFDVSGIESVPGTDFLSMRYSIVNFSDNAFCSFQATNLAPIESGSITHTSCDTEFDFIVNNIELDDIGEGVWFFNHSLSQASFGGGRWDYTLTFDVGMTNVSAPGALALLLLGVLGMSRAKRPRV